MGGGGGCVGGEDGVIPGKQTGYRDSGRSRKSPIERGRGVGRGVAAVGGPRAAIDSCRGRQMQRQRQTVAPSEREAGGLGVGSCWGTTGRATSPLCLRPWVSTWRRPASSSRSRPSTPELGLAAHPAGLRPWLRLSCVTKDGFGKLFPARQGGCGHGCAGRPWPRGAGVDSKKLVSCGRRLRRGGPAPGARVGTTVRSRGLWLRGRVWGQDFEENPWRDTRSPWTRCL